MNDEFDPREAQAADYVFGTQNAAERAETERQMGSDPELARLVGEWSARMAPVAVSLPPVTPPAQVWHAIERELDARQASDPLIDLEVLRASFVRRLQFWRWTAVTATAVAATLAVFISLNLPGPGAPEGNQFVAMLNEGGSGPTWLVTVDLDSRSLSIRPVETERVPDRDYELWLVAGSDQPRSLGLLDPDGEVSFALVREVTEAALPDAALAVSLEPLGGSPTGLPTGPVLYQGALLPLSK